MRNDVKSEILSQRDRMAADLFAREVAVALTCAMFAFILPWPVVSIVWVVCILSEIGDFLCYRAIERRMTTARHVALLANSAVAFAAFSLLGVLSWNTGDTMLRYIALLTLVGALVNVSTARSIHLPLGLTCGILPALALIWIATAGFRSGGDIIHAALASVATVILIGYFISALIQNNRTQRALTAETDRARDASAAKSRFISEMSHEMRTPLNAIGGLALHLRDADDASVRQAAHAIGRATDELAAVVDEVFDLAAAAEGHLFARPVTVDIRREARLFAKVLANSGEDVSSRVPVSVAPDVPQALTFDPVLVQKLLRLLAAIAPAALRSAGEPEWMSIANDPGRKGLSITLRFRRGVAGAGPPTSPQSRTESGQSLAAELGPILSRLLGAQVAWSDQKPSGPQVAVTFPASLPGLPDESLTAQRALAPTPPPVSVRRALVVDDIATNRFILVQMLRKLNIAATEADSGPAALAALDQSPFDIVLLDMNMPLMDGIETFRGIRARGTSGQGTETTATLAGGTGRAVPVIALTADGVGNRDRLLRLGLDGYVAKPVEPHRLQSEIDLVLSPHQRPQGSDDARTASSVSSDYPSVPPGAPAP